ncbi:membrane protein DedA, SNARE-associated domain [Stigmatella aurantiaca]|uniref:Membrane protein DedA, SNARE-associated domain n=1 Tax=Stigmatella aurantiaca TaxID=41 RepID=A0A1H7X3R2_STIAU|nr:DedA family protein [Stigmatella aurantiaca]SEM27837.1 membrane protein DedA, SNARE-associated domain [Stigmatella aurantiaca]
MVEFLDNLIRALGMAGVLLLGLAAMLEYLVPPFPGDTITLLGGVYAVRGDHPWPLVFLVVTAGSVAGAAINYWFGTWLARRFDAKPDSSFLGLTHARLAAVQAKMRRGGPWLLLVNRFLPGIRGVIFIAAGAARMPRSNALLLGAVSAMVHNALVLSVGRAVGGNLERLEGLMARYQLAVVVLVVIGVLAVLIRTLARRTPAT